MKGSEKGPGQSLARGPFINVGVYRVSIALLEAGGQVVLQPSLLGDNGWSAACFQPKQRGHPPGPLTLLSPVLIP